jgi:membrane associated rhomboid family serine protease
MTSGMILSGIFLIFSVVITVVCFTVLKKKDYSKFVGASAGVYASACLLVFLFSFMKKDLPILFFVLAEFLVTGIFVMTSFMMIFLLSKTSSVTAKQDENKEKEDVNTEEQ